MAKPRASTIQQRFGFRDDDLKKPDHDTMMLWLDANAEQVVKDLFGDKTYPTRKVWEYPVMSGVSKQYCIGFVDMLIHCDGIWCDVAVEIKTSIPSLGELIRQIRMYQQYLKKIPFVIISPDDRFQSALESQGIKFYKYEGDSLDTAML